MAIDVFGEPGLRSERLDLLAAAAWEQLEAAEPGSERQLAWARAWISSAGLDQDGSRLRGLLDGSVEVRGLDIDTDIRWHLVASLASQDAETEPLIAAELARDATSLGRDHAEAARAARPSPEAKAAAWTSFLQDPPLPTPTLTGVIRGFQRFGQRELLEPYAGRYFEALPALWEQGDVQTALAFTRGAFPHVIIDPATAAATDRFIMERSPTGPARRLLVEGRDGIQRALAARAADTADD
jgi:aminopeptidase N